MSRRSYLRDDRLVMKRSDTTRTTTTTPAADPELTVTLDAGWWAFEAWLLCSGDSAENIRVNHSHSGTATVYRNNDATSSSPQNVTTSANTTLTLAGAGTYRVIHLFGSIDATTSGTFAITWAQNVSGAVGVTMHAGAWLRVRRG